MPIVSLSMRTSAYAENTDDIPVVLLTLTHPQISSPLLLSSDPTLRLTTEPLSYGTISKGLTYQWVIMSVHVPDDSRDSPPRAQLVLDNVEYSAVPIFNSMTTYATISMSLVMASRPDFIERHWSGLNVVDVTVDADKVSLSISREPFTREPFPSDRMTRSRFPGLWHG